MRNKEYVSSAVATLLETTSKSPETPAPIKYLTLKLPISAIKFNLEQLKEDPTKLKVTLTKQLVDKTEERISTINKGNDVPIEVLPETSIQVKPDGSIQLSREWPGEEIYYEFVTDGDIYLDGLESPGKIKLSGNKIKAQQPLNVNKLELEAVTVLELAEVRVKNALVINYQGEETQYQVGKIVSKGTVELNCPNCNLEQLSSIRARDAIRMFGKQITIKNKLATKGGDLILTTTAKEDSYSIVNQGTLQVTGNLVITGYGFSQEGECGSGGNVRLNVTNLNLQRQVSCNGDFDCVLEGAFTQTKEAKIAVAGSFKLKAAQDIITNAPIDAGGKLTIDNGLETAILKTNGGLISDSEEGIEIITSRFVNRSNWKTSHGSMRIYTSRDFAEQHSLNQGEIVCAGNLEIDTLGLHLAAGMVRVDGDFIINSDALALTIGAPCKVVGDIRAYNIRSEQFAYAAEVLQAKGNIDLKFLQGVTLQQSINTPGNVTIEVVSKKEVALRQLHQLCPYINLNGSNINAAHHAVPGLTYLNYYLSQGDTKMVQLLVQAVASVTLTDNRGVRARDFLETITNLKLREKLAAVLQSWGQELPTISKTRTEILQELHNFNRSINLNGSNLNGVYQGPGAFNPGMTYLTCYLGRGDVATVQLLVDAGASPTTIDSRGVKPSDMIETIKDEQLRLQLTMILAIGARPLSTARVQPPPQILQALHEACPYINLNGSNINTAHHTFPGLTYLNYYLSQGDVKMVQLLVQAGASVTLADSRGIRPRDMLSIIRNLKLRTELAAILQTWGLPLLPVISKTRTEMLQELYNFNNSINLDGSNLNGVYQGPGVFNQGMTYLTCYLGRGDVPTVQLLVDAGVNTTATDSRGVKPSDMLETIKDERLRLQLATILQLGARPVAKVASQTIEIMAPIKAKEAISLKAPLIRVTSTGMLASKTEVTLTSQEATLLGLCRAQQVAIDVTGALIYARDSFNTATLIITRTNGFALTTPLNNPGGSLNLTIKSGATADLLVLAPITAASGVHIITPTKIKVGHVGKLQQITASTGVLQLEAGAIDNSWGQLFGQGVALQTLGDILNGVHVCGTKQYSVEGLNYDDYFYAGNGAFIASGGDLTVQANAWRNYNAVVHVAGNLTVVLQGRLYNQSGQISCGGNADFSRCVLENTFHGFTTSLVYVCYAHTTQPLLSVLHTHPTSTRPLVQINGHGVFNAIENQGIINAVAGGTFLQQIIQTTSCSKYEIYVGNRAPSHSLAIHSDYTASTNRGWWLGLYYKGDSIFHRHGGLVPYGNDYINVLAYPCLITKITEVHQGNLAGGTVSITAPQVTLTGVVSAIQELSILDFNKAVIGNSNSLAQLPFKPFKPVIRLLDYEHPGNGLYTTTAVGESPTVMRLTIPIHYTSVALPMVVVSPQRFSLNHKGLRPLLTPFQEQQNLVQALIDVTGNSQDAEHTTPWQLYYSYREAAYEALQQYTGTEVESSGTSLEVLQHEHPRLTKPILVYQEIEYCGTNSREFVLSPLVWFPKSYDNPYVRNGMGLLRGEHVYLHGKETEQSVLYIGGCVQAKRTLEASCRDRLTISGTIQGETAALTSHGGDVEIISRTTRLSKVNGYDDVAIPAEIIAEDTIEIEAKTQDILLQGATTRSGTITTMHAGHQIIDRPLPLFHYRTQEVHGDRYGTISDTHIEQSVSKHSSGTGKTTGKIIMEGDFGVELHAPEFNSREVEITSSEGKVEVLDVTEAHLHEEHLQEDGDGLFSRDKTINSETMTGTSKGAQFEVKELTITGKTGITLQHITSHAETNKFRAPGATITMKQGENESRSFYSEHSKNIAWQKQYVSQRHDVTYSPSVFTGTIEIDASTLHLEEVRDTTLDFIQRIVKNNATIQRTILDEKHEHHEESHSGPSPELMAVAAITIGVLTNGMGAQFLSSLSGVLGETAVNAGFSALCSQAGVKLLEAKGDPFKALKSLATTKTVKDVAIAMISGKLLDKVKVKLKLPEKIADYTTMHQLQYNVARASIATMLNVTINGEKLEKAIPGGIVDAAVGTMAGVATHEIGALYNLNELDPLTHKLAHGLVGGLSGMALKGEKGFVAGAIGAMAAEVTAEALQPEELAFVKEVTKEEQNKGRKLTVEERQELRSAFKIEKDVKTLNKDVNKAFDYSKITAATTAFFLHQDVNLANQTATTSLENNFLQNAMLYIDYYRYLEEANLRDGVQQAESKELKKAEKTRSKSVNSKDKMTIKDNVNDVKTSQKGKTGFKAVRNDSPIPSSRPRFKDNLERFNQETEFYERPINKKVNEVAALAGTVAGAGKELVKDVKAVAKFLADGQSAYLNATLYPGMESFNHIELARQEALMLSLRQKEPSLKLYDLGKHALHSSVTHVKDTCKNIGTSLERGEGWQAGLHMGKLGYEGALVTGVAKAGIQFTKTAGLELGKELTALGKKTFTHIAENTMSCPKIWSLESQLGYIGKKPAIAFKKPPIDVETLKLEMGATWDGEKLVFGSAKKSIKYKANLVKSQGFQDHHIIPESLGEHELFELSGLDIQSRTNKVFLPGAKSEYFHGESGRSQHWGKHDDIVFERIKNLMKDTVKTGKSEGWSQEQYLQKQLKIIDKERKLLKTGERRLNKNHRHGAHMVGGIATGLGLMTSGHDAEASTPPSLLFSSNHQQQRLNFDDLFIQSNTATTKEEVIRDEQPSSTYSP